MLLLWNHFRCFGMFWVLHTLYRRVRRPRRTACKFICTNYTVGERIALPHHVKWARTNNVHHNKMVRKTKPSRPFSILHSQFSIRHALTQNKRTAQPGQSFLQQRQLSIREIYNFQSALLRHMHGLRGTARPSIIVTDEP